MSPNETRVLLTGGSGFIGTHLVTKLLGLGYAVRVLDLRPPSIEHEKLDFIDGSFFSVDILDQALNDVDVLYHLAATKFPLAAQKDTKADIIENILGSYQLFELAHQARVKKIIFASSGGTVYGEPVDVPVLETHPTAPISSYGISKLAIEKYLASLSKQHGFNYLVLRAANPFGPGQNIKQAQGALTTFCIKALKSEKIEIWGDGSVERDYIYISDLVDAFALAMDATVTEGIVNIGSGQGTSLNQLLAILEKRLGRPIDVVRLSGRDFDVARNFLGINEAKNLLNWEPKVSLEDGIAFTLADMTDRLDQDQDNAE